MADILYKTIPLEVKAGSAAGTFSGYLSRFNEKDQGGDIVMPGAFAKSLAIWKESGRAAPILWQHMPREPIGDWSELKEDDTGLLSTGSLWLDDAPYAKLAHKGMKTKTITGLSIGYSIDRADHDNAKGAFLLHELTLHEGSVVTSPMLDTARVDAVKCLLSDGTLPTMKEFEDFLRESGGFSKSQATIVASRGLGQLLKRSDSAGEANGAAVLDMLSGWKITP